MARLSTRRKLWSRQVKSRAQRRTGQKPLTSKQNGDSVSRAKETATICLLLCSTRKASLNQRSYSLRTTPTNGANLATPCTWWSRSARGNLAKNPNFTHRHENRRRKSASLRHRLITTFDSMLPSGCTLRDLRRFPFEPHRPRQVVPSSPAYLLRSEPKCPTAVRCSHQRIR